tara:strand:- start:44 stop:577 length:534 start_codon:yes stop_codon:yes gene_type:complete
LPDKIKENILIDKKEIKNKLLKRENFYYIVIISIIFYLDRFSKIQIINNFSDTSNYFNSFINFDLVWNTGIGFGLLSSNSSLVYNLITAIIGIVILYLFYIVINSKLFDSIVFSVIIGGALGNFYDRLIFYAVPDFIDVHYKNFHWFTFNIADIFITIGIIIFIIKGLFEKNTHEKN